MKLESVESGSQDLGHADLTTGPGGANLPSTIPTDFYYHKGMPEGPWTNRAATVNWPPTYNAYFPSNACSGGFTNNCTAVKSRTFLWKKCSSFGQISEQDNQN